jgi:hypothetical protein
LLNSGRNARKLTLKKWALVTLYKGFSLKISPAGTLTHCQHSVMPDVVESAPLLIRASGGVSRNLKALSISRQY